MATRCLIGNLKEGAVTYIYCHFDGYLEGVGACLLKHYASESKVLALLEMGDLVSLAANLTEVKPDTDNSGRMYQLEQEGIYGSYQWLKKNWDDIEFVYLRKNDGWYFKTWSNHTWKKLDVLWEGMDL